MWSTFYAGRCERFPHILLICSAGEPVQNNLPNRFRISFILDAIDGVRLRHPSGRQDFPTARLADLNCHGPFFFSERRDQLSMAGWQSPLRPCRRLISRDRASQNPDPTVPFLNCPHRNLPLSITDTTVACSSPAG
jgi:hypothetical protein